MSKHDLRTLTAAGLLVALLQPACFAAGDYEIGGPLAGLKLPLYPVYHGEPPGHPGNSFGPPESLLYDGAVEHWRGYWFKYCPQRSFFDRQSMLKNWTAPEIPGASSRRVEQYAQPIYNVPRFDTPKPTGKTAPPVDVLRFRAGDTILSVDLGELDRGLYAVRVIGAVPTDQATDFQRNLFFLFSVNDKVGGGESLYRRRGGYVDEFYSVVEMYFHAPEKRRYHVKLSLDQATEIELLVRNVTLDDALAGIERGAFKKKSNDPLPPEAIEWYKRAQSARLADPSKKAARLERDALIWNSYPRINTLYDWTYHDEKTGVQKRARPAFNGKSFAQIEEEFGKWEDKWSTPNNELPILLTNHKLNLKYTIDDLNNGRPLPDPFPVKDDGNGVAKIDPQNPACGELWTRVARAVTIRRLHYQHRAMALESILKRDQKQWPQSPEEAHDAIIAFARFVYDLPALDAVQDIGCVILRTGPYGRENYNRRRETTGWFYTWYTEYATICELYEKYFDLVKDNQELADSLHRFIPWIRTPQDVIQLFDTYLLQHTAKRILRYHYYVGPVDITRVATVLGDPRITKPWMEWQFTRTHVYPLPLSGIGFLTVSGNDRSGIEYGTSSFYGCGEHAARAADGLEKYVAASGNREFSLDDPERYPKARQALYWPLRMLCAGWHYPRIGDVTGPDKPPDHYLTNSMGLLRSGWLRTRDPRFAAMLAHLDKQGSYKPDEWKAIQEAAADLRRMPYMENRSRFIPNWAGVLETGTEHDDYRFRRAVTVRTGRGIGHQHNDTLDLQLVAHGIPLLVDAGQRPGYTKPPSQSTSVHNLVAVGPEGQSPTHAYYYSWVRNILHSPDAAYLLAWAGEPNSLACGARQVALMDVDEGRGSQSLPIEKQKPGVKLPTDIVTPNSYVFDVFRITGPGTHRYNFHAMVDDEFSWNAQNETKDPKGFYGEATFTADQTLVGTAPATLQATWRMRREPEGKENTHGTEKSMMGVNYDPNSPPKYVRLHLLDVAGAKTHRARLTCTEQAPIHYQMTCISVESKPASLQAGSCHVAVIEPYVGEPFIRSVQLLPVVGATQDARRPVAVSVETTTGVKDILFANSDPTRPRVVAGGSLLCAAEFAWQSSDAEGLRSAGLTNGTLLETPLVRIEAKQREIIGKIVSVNYRKRQFEVDVAWPIQSDKPLVEIGHERKMTAFSIASMRHSGANRTVMETEDAADHIWTNITDINPEKKQVDTALRFTPSPGPGEQYGWVATNASMTKTWRAQPAGAGFVLQSDEPLKPEDFAPENELRIWEYGVGDTVRQSTNVTIRRTGQDRYEITTLTAATIEIAGASATVESPDGTRRDVTGEKGRVKISLPAAVAGAGVVRVEVRR